jgi:hypothetical protein
MTYLRKFFGTFTTGWKNFWGRFPKGYGSKKFFNACSGFPTHRHNYLNMLELANKILFKINSPYWLGLRLINYALVYERRATNLD